MSDRRSASRTKVRRYRKRRKAGCRIWKPELHIDNTEALLLGLGYLDGMTEYTKKEADEALAKFVGLMCFVTSNSADADFALRKLIEDFEAARDQDP